MAKMLSLRRLEEARKRAAEVTLEIARWEGSCLRRDYTTRWALVYVACRIRHAASPFLPQHRFNADTSGRAVALPRFRHRCQETVLRTTAVDGVGALATDCHSDAVTALLISSVSQQLSIRRAAVQCLLSTAGGSRLRHASLNIYPQEQYYLLELKRPHVSKVPTTISKKLPRSGAAATSIASPPIYRRNVRIYQSGMQRAASLSLAHGAIQWHLHIHRPGQRRQR